MADAVLTLGARYTGRGEINKAERDILKVKLASMGASNAFNKVAKHGDKMAAAIGRSGKKFKRIMTDWDKLVRGFGTIVTKVFGAATKFFVAEFALMAASMVAVHVLMKAGRWIMKAYHGAIKMAGAAAAGAAAAISILSAAIREQQAAMFSYKGLTGNFRDLTSGTSAVRSQMRGMATDIQLATLGVENLNTIFAGASQRGTYSQGLAKGLLDVAHAGKAGEEASKWIGEVVGMLTDPDVNWNEIEKAFKGMGKQGETMLEGIRKGGVETVEEMKKAIKSGELAVFAGVAGQFDAVSGTLMSRLKGAFTIIRTDFADLGDAFMGDTKESLDEVVHIFRRMFVRIHGGVMRFGKGGFLNTIVTAAEWIERNMVKLISKWLPQAEGMFGRMAAWWDNFKTGWKEVVASLDPLIQGAQVIEDMFTRILRPMGEYLKSAFGSLGDDLFRNKAGFEEFGDAVGNLLVQFFGLTTEIKKLWMESMPFISKVVDGLSEMFEMAQGLVRAIGGIFGGISGGMAGFAPMAALMMMRMGGKQLAGTRGTLAAQSTQTMHVQAGTVNVGGRATGATRGGNLGGKGGGQFVPIGGRGGLESRQAATGAALRSQGRVAAPGGGYLPAGYGTGRMAGWKSWGRGLNQLPGAGEEPRYTAYQRLKGRTARFTGGRGAMGASRIAGSMGGRMGTMMGMGILGGMMSEEAQGSMAMGSMLSMIDPRLGIGVGLGGAALKSQTVMGGMGTGAAAGAALGIYAGPWGAAAGAIIGGVAGAISGHFGKDRALTKEVRANAKKGADQIWESMLGGIQDATRMYGSVGFTAKRAQEALKMEPLRDLLGLNYVEGGKQGISQGLDMDRNPEGTGAKKRGWQDWAKIGALAVGVGLLASTGVGLLAMGGAIGGMTAAGTGAALLGAGGGLGAGVTAATIGGAATAGTLAAGGMTAGGWFPGDVTPEEGHLMRQSIVQDLYDNQSKFGLEMSSEELKKNLKKPKEYLEDMGGELASRYYAASEVTQKYGDRMAYLVQLTGQGEQGVRALAEAAGVNLYDATMDTTDMIKQLASSMVSTAEQVNQLFDQIQANAFDAFRIAIDKDEAAFALDERGAALRETVLKEGGLSEEQARVFLSDTLTDFTALFEGDSVAGTKAFLRMFGEGGDAFTQENGLLNIPGMEEMLMQGGNDEIIRQMVTEVIAAQGTVDREYLQGIGLGLGYQATGFGALTEDQRIAVNELMAGGDLMEAGIGTAQSKLRAIPGLEGLTFSSIANQVEGTSAAALDLDLAGQHFLASTGQFNTDVTQFHSTVTSLIGRMDVSGVQTHDLSIWHGGAPIVDDPSDTATSRYGRFGDTSSAFAGTMTAHNRISGSLAGKRLITSGYRNYALGSSSSDHLTGRALDLTGNNLGAYGDRVRAGGGFAEMHGVSGSRHLHAVPAGDTTSSRGMSGGMGSTYNYTINVTGGPDAGAEEIAMLVMTEIQDLERSNRERA